MKPKEKTGPLFKLETELCAAFLSTVSKTEWTPYPETAGWDILLVRVADGFQIGVQAKLRLNAHVITQALDRWYGCTQGPDVRAVLVPGAGSGGLDTICKLLGIVVITVDKHNYAAWDTRREKDHFYSRPELPKPPEARGARWDSEYQAREWPETGYLKREKLPEYVPDVPAGAAAPVQLTAWKIGALKLAILMERRGCLTRADFKALHMDSRRWLPSAMGWLLLDPANRGRYTKAPAFPDFKAMHPTNWQQIEADFEKWAPKPPPPSELEEQKGLDL